MLKIQSKCKQIGSAVVVPIVRGLMGERQKEKAAATRMDADFIVLGTGEFAVAGS